MYLVCLSQVVNNLFYALRRCTERSRSDKRTFLALAGFPGAGSIYTNVCATDAVAEWPT
ncbi:MAG: hypothetical protein PHC61_04790 [Chitinivibrionales bacterium]|nr:hypothetical protein [Chitinivibrionales bacterium]